MPSIRYLQKPNLFATWIRKELHKYFMNVRRKFMATGDERFLEDLEFIQLERRIQCPESFIVIVPNKR